MKENRSGYTQSQFKKAVRARELYHLLGAPTLDNYKGFIKMNGVHNCSVRLDDIIIAENIFGPDMATLKGKSTRPKPKPVLKDWIELPREIMNKHAEVELCMDIMFINGVKLMTAIDRTIRFRSVVPIQSRENSHFIKAINAIVNVYHRAGFSVTTIYCDREFKPLFNELWQHQQIYMNFANTGDHVGEAERNNRFLKERFRIKFHLLPYKAITEIMIRYMAMKTADESNYFPVKNGVSSHYSPRMIIQQKSLDYHRDCQVPFGSYVEANVETTNTPKARTRSAIYLRTATSLQGGHEVMALDTGKLLSSPRVTKLPLTDIVIRTVENMARVQGFKELKFNNRRHEPMHDATRLAGVEMEENVEIAQPTAAPSREYDSVDNGNGA